MKKQIITIFLLIAILLSSCAMTETIKLNKDNSGTSTTDISVKDFFVQVVEDAATLTENKTDSKKTFAENTKNQFIEYLSKNPNISNLKTSIVGDNAFIGNFDFNNLQEVFNQMSENKAQNVIMLSDNSIKIHIGFDNYNEIEEMIPFLKDPGFETFGPRYNEGLTADEYYEMISYILGDEGPTSIANSKIIFNITTPSKIKTIKNGKKLTSTSAQFTINLIDFLLLSKDLDYEITY